MAVTLMRHTTPDIGKGICYGATDLPLASSFETELAQILEQLPQMSVIVSSPLSRCLRLATRLAAHCDCELSISTLWKEMDFGSWEGLAWDDVPRPELDAWAADFLDYSGHGGESVGALRNRVASGLRAAPENALIVTHQGAIKAALALNGASDGWRAETPFGGMVRLD